LKKTPPINDFKFSVSKLSVLDGATIIADFTILDPKAIETLKYTVGDILATNGNVYTLQVDWLIQVNELNPEGIKEFASLLYIYP